MKEAAKMNWITTENTSKSMSTGSTYLLASHEAFRLSTICLSPDEIMETLVKGKHFDLLISEHCAWLSSIDSIAAEAEYAELNNLLGKFISAKCCDKESNM